MEFTEKQQERYARQLILPEIGMEGQKKMADARILIIGAGGLGSPAAMYLAAAGIGTIGIADADAVDLSNLQRQIIHGTPDLNRPKTESAAETMQQINPEIQVQTYHTYVTKENISDMISTYDFIIDATDNFDSKFLINDTCVAAQKAFCHAGILRFQGQLMTWVPNMNVPCYRCIFKEPPPQGAVPTGRQAGVIGAVAGVIGCLEAMEAIKYITGAGELLTGQLLTYDALTNTFRRVRFSKDDQCPACTLLRR